MAIDKTSYTKTKHAGIKRHKNGLKFWFDFKVANKRYARFFTAKPDHSATDRLKTAYQALEDLKVKIIHENSLSVDIHSTVGDYWIKVKQLKSWKPTMLKKYNYYFNKHLHYLNDIKITDVKPAHLTALNISLSNLAPSTQSKAYEILKPIFFLALEDELIIRSPIKESHLPKRKQIEEKKIITQAVVKYKLVHKAIHQLYGSNDLVRIGTKHVQCQINHHHKALFLFGFSGRRRTETTSLQWEDIDFDNDKYIIRAETSKVNTDMVFNLPAEVKIALLEFRDITGNVFNVKDVYRHYDKIRLLTGIQEFSFHWMRNLSVSALSSEGASLTDLTSMLGHQDSATLKKYLSLQRDENTKRTDALAELILNNDKT